MSNENNKNNEQLFSITINEQHYKWAEKFINGMEIRELGNIDNDDDLYLKVNGPDGDLLITTDYTVDLQKHGTEKFYSNKGNKIIVIIVNGREKPWDSKKISFEQVVVLAFGSYEENQNRVYTVTYKGGPNDNPQGEMVKGDIVSVKNKMIFNVTATDKS